VFSGDCVSIACKNCTVVDVSNRSVNGQLPQCRCGFSLNLDVVNGLLADNEMLLGDNSIHKCHRSERSAPEERRDFSIEHGYPLCDYRSEILKRIRQPRVEEAATNEVAVCSQIGRAQKYQYAI